MSDVPLAEPNDDVSAWIAKIERAAQVRLLREVAEQLPDTLRPHVRRELWTWLRKRADELEAGR